MKSTNKFLFFIVVVFSFLCLAMPYTNIYADKIKSDESGSRELNVSNLKAFLNGVTKESFEKYRLPSLCMVVVKDGKIVYQNALGYADIKNKIRANIDTTAYRVGSVSKLFTETAVMQLYEQGKIDLNADANKYLRDIKIQNRYDKKVTVENLLTHTSGIDEATTPYGSAKTKKEMLPLSKFLKKHTPVVVTEPGKICLYSNIGLDLLGYIIENVSGMSYEEYIQKNILDKLDMKNSRVALPLRNMAKNYDSFAKTDYYYYNDNPAGGINASTADIAKFMIAHLQNGTYKNSRILKRLTAKLMHEHKFSNDSNLSGICYGFWEKNINGRRVIGHEGALAIGFYDDLLLYPEESLGVYIVSNNLTKAATAVANIENAFFNRYYKNNNTAGNSFTSRNEIGSKEASKYIGTYRSYHDNAKSNFSKFVSFMGAIDENEDVQIKYNKKKQTLIYQGISHLKKKENVRLIKISNSLFERADNNDLIAFRMKNGKAEYVFFNNAPFDSFERVGLKEDYKLSLGILMISMLFFMFCIIRGVFIALRNLVKKKKIVTIFNVNCNEANPSKSFEICINKIVSLIVFYVSLLNVIALSGIIYWIASFNIFYSVDWYVIISSIFLIISTVASICNGVLFTLSIKKENTTLCYKIFNFLSILIMFLFVFFMLNWNLLRF